MNDAETRAKLEEYRASINTRREKLARHVSHREEPLPQDFAEQAVELELLQQINRTLRDGRVEDIVWESYQFLPF